MPLSESPSLILRPAKLSDSLGIATTHILAWKKGYHGIVNQEALDKLNINDSCLWWQEYFPKETDSSVLLIAENGHNVIGFAYGFTTKEAPYESELAGLYVHPNFQRQGIGTKLLGAFTQIMSEQGAKNMFLWTAEKASSQKFYEKLKGQQTILRKETPEGDFHLQLISYVFDLPLELQPEF